MVKAAVQEVEQRAYKKYDRNQEKFRRNQLKRITTQTQQLSQAL